MSTPTRTDWTFEALDTVLLRRLQSRAFRCVFGIVRSPAAAWPEIIEHLRELGVREGIDADKLEIVAFDGEEESVQRARRLNQMRTSVLQELRLLVFLVPDATRLRLLLHLTPDLNTNPDFSGTLAIATERPWEAVAEGIRQLAVAAHGLVDLIGLLPHDTDHHAIPLTDLYLPLVRFGAEARQLGLFDPSRWHEEEEEPVGFGSPAREPSRSWLVLGNPGTGKTTALRHVALSAARGEPTRGLPAHGVAVLLSLAEWADERTRELGVGLDRFLVARLEASGVLGAEAILAHLDQTALLLDGLDEVRDPATRREALEQVRQLLARGLACVVVTARPFVLDLPGIDTGGFEVRHTLAPTDDEIARFVTVFGRARQRRPEELAALQRRILQQPTLRSLASTPLVLAFLCVLEELQGQLPEHRVEIYFRLSELLVERWRVARGRAASGSSSGGPSRGDALSVLGPLAIWRLERGGAPVPHHELLATLTRIEQTRREEPHIASERAGRLLDLLKSDTALLCRASDGRWSFVHLSLVEYFAAVETLRNPELWTALINDPFRPELREVLLLLAGHLSLLEGDVHRLDALSDAVLERSRRRGKYPASYPLLLVDLVREVPSLSTHHRRAFLDRILEFVLTNDFGEEAAADIQTAVVALLRSAAVSDLRDDVAHAMRAWFAPPRASIRWDRLAKTSLLALASLLLRGWSVTDREALEAAHAAMIEQAQVARSAGMLLDALPELLQGIGEEPSPDLRAHIDDQGRSWPDDMRRLADWLYTVERRQLERLEAQRG